MKSCILIFSFCYVLLHLRASKFEVEVIYINIYILYIYSVYIVYTVN